MTVIGGGRGKKGKKKRRQQQQQSAAPSEPKDLGDDNTINFSLDVLRTFAEVKVPAPAKVEDLKDAIAKLEEAEADFEA